MKTFKELGELTTKNLLTLLLLHIKDLEITKGFKVSITLIDSNSESNTISDKDFPISGDYNDQD